jgi:hypothetical protein
MKSAGIIWIVSSVILVGCVHTRQIGKGESEITPEEAFRSVTGEYVIVKMRSEQTIQGKALAVAADTLKVHSSESDSILHLPLSEVKSIETPGSPGGPLVGLVLGGLAGAGIGAAIGASEEPASGASLSSWGWVSNATFGTAIGSVIGVLAGVIIGANVTPGHRYVLPDSGKPESNLQKLKAKSERKGPTEYVIVKVKKILEETETSITIRWVDGKVTLPKSEITITQTKDGIDIKVPRWLWYGQE